MACSPTSDSCIWNEGVGLSGLCPAPAMNSPITLISGFNALAAAPPAPPSRTLSPAKAVERTASCGVVTCAWVAGAEEGVAGEAALCDAAPAPCALSWRNWPSSITMRSSRSRIFCSRAETSLLTPGAGTFAVCWAVAAQVSTTIKPNNIWKHLIGTPLVHHGKRHCVLTVVTKTRIQGTWSVVGSAWHHNNCAKRLCQD